MHIPEFVHYCIDLVRILGPVEPRRMFGSWGLFLGGRMFALVSEESLYLKVDAGNRAAFDALGLGALDYVGQGGRTVELPYRQAPLDAMDDPAEMRKWAQGAIDAALRTSAPKRPRPAAKAPVANGKWQKKRPQPKR